MDGVHAMIGSCIILPQDSLLDVGRSLVQDGRLRYLLQAEQTYRNTEISTSSTLRCTGYCVVEIMQQLVRLLLLSIIIIII